MSLTLVLWTNCTHFSSLSRTFASWKKLVAVWYFPFCCHTIHDEHCCIDLTRIAMLCSHHSEPTRPQRSKMNECAVCSCDCGPAPNDVLHRFEMNAPLCAFSHLFIVGASVVFSSIHFCLALCDARASASTLLRQQWRMCL